MNLADLQPGESGVVQIMSLEGAQRRRLLDIGLVKNTLVRCVGRSPSGDPSAYLIRGAVIALRAQDCRHISIELSLN